MLIGVPTEIKTREYRVGMLPAGVRALCARGHQVLVQEGAGLGAAVADAGGGAFAGSAGAVRCPEGIGVVAGLADAGRDAETGSVGGGSACLGCGGCTDAVGAAAEGASVAVSTNSVFAGGAGAGAQDMPINTSACSAIEASTHQNSARSSASGCKTPAVAAVEYIGQE